MTEDDPLIKAVHNGDLEEIKRLIEHASSDSRTWARYIANGRLLFDNSAKRLEIAKVITNFCMKPEILKQDDKIREIMAKQLEFIKGKQTFGVGKK